jgi:signal transduction histidine kinase
MECCEMTANSQPTTSALPTHQALSKLWAALIEPHPSVKAVDERRKVRVLLGSTAVLNILLLCGLIAVNALMDNSSSSKPTYLVIGFAVFCLALPLYFLAKTPRYLLVAGLLVAFIATVSCFFMLVTPGNTLFLYAIGLCLSLLVAGLYLPFRSVARTAVYTCVALVIVYNIHYPVVKTLLPTNPWIVESLDSFASTTTLMLLIAFNATMLLFFRLRDQIEADRQAERERAIQQQQLADDLRRTEQAKSAFLASMSHELRTPLNSILNFSEFVSTGLLGPVNTEQADALQKVIASGEHLLGLINDVLDITKIESGSLELFLEDVDMKAAVETAIATGQGLLRDKPIELKATIAPELPHIMGIGVVFIRFC